MAVNREFTCLAHGPFEGTEARCPHGCTTAVAREFRTAPAVGTAKAKATDAALERLAQRFGLTDISNRNGSVAASKPPAPAGLDFTPKWLPVAAGDNFEVGKGVVSREGSAGGANATAQQYRTERMGDEPAATETVPLPLGQLPPPPRPHVVGRDNVTSADFEKAIRSAA